MENLLTWFTDNIEVVLGTGGVSTLVFLALKNINEKLFPKLVLMFKGVLVTIMEQAFGFSREDSEVLMDKLPVVAKLESLEEKLRVDLEIKILEYESKLASPVYTDEEKAKFQEALDILMSQTQTFIQDKITENVE